MYRGLLIARFADDVATARAVDFEIIAIAQAILLLVVVHIRHEDAATMWTRKTFGCVRLLAEFNDFNCH